MTKNIKYLNKYSNPKYSTSNLTKNTKISSCPWTFQNAEYFIFPCDLLLDLFSEVAI